MPVQERIEREQVQLAVRNDEQSLCRFRFRNRPSRASYRSFDTVGDELLPLWRSCVNRSTSASICFLEGSLANLIDATDHQAVRLRLRQDVFEHDWSPRALLQRLAGALTADRKGDALPGPWGLDRCSASHS